MNVEIVVVLELYICFKISHFEMIVDPVHDEVREPRILSTSLEQLVEELQAFLTEVVSEYFETHQSLVLGECLSKQSQTEIVYLIVAHV